MVADMTTTLSFMERRMLQELQGTAHNLFTADQDSKAAHVISSALAYIRSLAASALETDPYDLTWKQVALVFHKAHQDMVMLGGLLLDKAVCTGGSYAIEQELALRSIGANMVRTNGLTLSRGKLIQLVSLSSKINLESFNAARTTAIEKDTASLGKKVLNTR